MHIDYQAALCESSVIAFICASVGWRYYHHEEHDSIHDKGCG